jgi:cephalosporin-C deacetylase-like acetyl esterase
MRRAPALCLTLLLPALAAGGAEPAAIEQKPDKSFAITGKTYTAAVDAEGNFRSLKLDGLEVLDPRAPGKGGAFPAKNGAAAVELKGHALVATSEGCRIEYTFDSTGFGVATQGGTVEFHPSGVTAAICEGGNTADAKEAIGDVRKLVFGRLALGLSKPFHHMFGRLVPSHLCGRGGKPEDPFAYRVDCGVAFDAAELLTSPDLHPEGRDPGKVADYAPGETPAFEYLGGNLGPSDVTGEVRFTLLDHCVNGKTLLRKSVAATFLPGAKTSVKFPTPEANAPGFYWLHAEFLKDGKPCKKASVAFICDGAHYKPPLTRPADFRAFWEKKLAALRALPFDAKLVEAPAKSNERFTHYDLELTVAPGKRIKTFLRVPKAPGKYDGEVVSHWGSDTEDKVLKQLAEFEGQKPGVGMWERGVLRVRVGAPQPDDSTYTRWNGADDNNLLDSFLRTVRMTDYLRAREDVAGIFLYGGSRSGAIQLANAALDPARVLAVNVHVPTCAGLSWKEKEYRGWGSRPTNLPPEQSFAVAAYFDVTNFAPDLTVPVVTDGGITDDLAPAPGILAFVNWAEKSPFRRVSIEKGGHGFFSNPARPKMEKDLAEFLTGKAILTPVKP